MSDHDGLHILWNRDNERMNIAGPFASEAVARFAATHCSPDAVLVDIRFVDDPAPLLRETTDD